MAGERGEQRQHQQQNQRKAGILHGDDRMMERMRQASAAMLMMPEVNSASTVSTSPEKRAATSPGFCLPACRRKLGQLPGHFRAQGVGHFLAEEHQQALLRRGEHPFQRQTAEIKKHRMECQRKSCRQPVDDAGQQQRRHQRRRHRCRRTQDGPRCEKAVGHGGIRMASDTPFLRLLSMLFPSCLAFVQLTVDRGRCHQLLMGADGVFPPSIKTIFCICEKWYRRCEMRKTTLSLAYSCRSAKTVSSCPGRGPRTGHRG